MYEAVVELFAHEAVPVKFPENDPEPLIYDAVSVLTAQDAVPYTVTPGVAFEVEIVVTYSLPTAST